MRNHINVFQSIPHLNNVSTLFWETWNAHCAHTIPPLSCYWKTLQNLSQCNCGLQICRIWIQLITACGNIVREGVQNRHRWSGPIEDATDEWLLQWQHDPAGPTPFLVAVSVCPHQQWIFLTTCFAIFSTHSNQLDWNLAKWRPQVDCIF